VGRNKVPDKEEDGHDDVLSNRDDIGAGDLQDLGVVLDCSVEVNVIRADTSRDTEFQVLGLHERGYIFTGDKNRDTAYLLEDVSREVSRVERCSDQDLSLNKDAEIPRNNKFGGIEIRQRCAFGSRCRDPPWSQRPVIKCGVSRRIYSGKTSTPTIYSCPCDSRYSRRPSCVSD